MAKLSCPACSKNIESGSNVFCLCPHGTIFCNNTDCKGKKLGEKPKCSCFREIYFPPTNQSDGIYLSVRDDELVLTSAQASAIKVLHFSVGSK